MFKTKNCYTEKLKRKLERTQSDIKRFEEYIKKYEDLLNPLKEEEKELKRLTDMFDNVYSMIPKTNNQK